MELVCPAGNLAALRTAIDAGADTVYAGFCDETNARNFPGLNFSADEMHDGVAYAHAHGRKVYIAINTFPRAGGPDPWLRAIDGAARLGADAIIVADIGLLDYARREQPQLRRHLSVQAGASNREAITFFRDALGVSRVVLPRVLTIAEIAALNAELGVETEVFAFGGMCPMAEGRCSLSSYATGQSPNMSGVCSPASHVHYERRGGEMVSRLAAFTINRFGAGEAAGYPTLCKGRFVARERPIYLFEEPTSLSVAHMLHDLAAAGVSALKIEGRQRGRAYVGEVVARFRRLVDDVHAARPAARSDVDALRQLAEGQRDTAGAYRRSWR